MNKAEIKKMLQDNVVEVKFEKADGSERTMTCTLAPELINYETAGESVESDSLVTVWDLEKDAWRRFRMDSLLENPSIVVE